MKYDPAGEMGKCIYRLDYHSLPPPFLFSKCFVDVTTAFLKFPTHVHLSRKCNQEENGVYVLRGWRTAAHEGELTALKCAIKRQDFRAARIIKPDGT